MKKVLAYFMTFCIILFSFAGCSLFKSDEELIKNRIEKFSYAYNTGDLNAIIECFDTKSRNKYKAAINIAENIGGAVLGKLSKSGLGLNIADLFGFSVGTVSNDDLLNIEIIQINILDEQNASIEVKMGYKDKMSDFSTNAVFTMLKENGDWYIKDCRKK